MLNPVSKILAALLAVLLLYVVPAIQQALRQEDITLLAANHSLTEFVDSVRTKGYISPVMYEEFSRNLEAAGRNYEVEMEHQHKTYHPEYTDPADPSTFQQEYSIQYQNHYTSELLAVIFPNNIEPRDSKERKYLLEAGDYFTVSIHPKDADALSAWTSMLYHSEARQEQSSHYGGMVLNEDY